MWDIEFGKVYISFDHDIQDFNNGVERTGYTCVKFLCDYLQSGKIYNGTFMVDIDCYFHTQNPIGKKNMETYWNNFVKVYKEK